MPIVLRHEAAGIPAGQNPNRKYGQSMVLQQQQADQNMRLRAQDAQYDMQRIGAMAQMRQPSIGEEASMLDQEIRSGLYEPDTVRALRDDERMIGQIMRDRRIDGTQRAQALENIQSRMRMMRATGKRMEPTMQPIMQGSAQPSAQPPRTAQAAFRADPKLEDRFMALVNETPGSENMTYEQKLQRAIGYYNERERALADPSSQPQGQPAAQQPNAPAPAQGAPSPTTTSAMPPGSFSGGQQTFGASPVLAQPARMSAPSGQSAYQPTGNYTSPEVFGAANVLANPAQPPQPQGQPAVQQSNSQPYTAVSGGSVVDTAYDLVNADRSPATNFYDPENPEYARMRSADQSIVNPQRETLGKPGGRYGLGMVDYGINPATGNRVTASIRPGSTMPEYDEPVGAPGTAMGGQKGTVTWQGRKGKKSETVSPGEQWSNANPYPESMPSVSSAPQSQAQEILPPETMDIPRDGIVSPMDPKRSGRPGYLEQKPPATQGEMSGWRESIRNFVTGREPGWGEPLPQEKNKKASTSKTTSTKNATRQNPWAEVGGPSASATDEVSRARNDLEAINSSQSTASGGSMVAIRKFAESQPAAIRDAIKEFYNPNTSRERAKAIAKMLLEKNIDLGAMEKAGEAPVGSNSSPVSSSVTPSTEQGASAGNEASSGRKRPAYVSVAPENPVESSYQTVEIKERTPQAALFLEKMKKFADSKGTAVSKAVMGVYDPKTPEATKVELIRGLAKMGVNLPDIEKRLKAEVLSQMTPERTPKYPLKPRGFPTKETSPRIFES